MPDGERCRWTDMSPLLDDSQRKRFGKKSVRQNEALANDCGGSPIRFLRIPGNETAKRSITHDT